MARRLPKLLVPVLVALVAIVIAMWAVLPSSAGQVAPPADGVPLPGASTVAPVKDQPSTPATTEPTTAKPTTTPTGPTAGGPDASMGPKDCVGCGVDPGPHPRP